MSNSLQPIDCNPPGSSVHGIFQARILECFAISFSRGSSWLRGQTRVSCTAGSFFTDWATREALHTCYLKITLGWEGGNSFQCPLLNVFRWDGIQRLYPSACVSFVPRVSPPMLKWQLQLVTSEGERYLSRSFCGKEDSFPRNLNKCFLVSL